MTLQAIRSICNTDYICTKFEKMPKIIGVLKIFFDLVDEKENNYNKEWKLTKLYRVILSCEKKGYLDPTSIEIIRYIKNIFQKFHDNIIKKVTNIKCNGQKKSLIKNVPNKSDVRINKKFLDDICAIHATLPLNTQSSYNFFKDICRFLNRENEHKKYLNILDLNNLILLLLKYKIEGEYLNAPCVRIVVGSTTQRIRHNGLSRRS